MKKTIFLAVGLLVIAVLNTFAQTATPKTTTRQAVQRARIAEGVESGELTAVERRRLKAEQRHIRRTKRRVKADGVVTSEEQRRLDRKQNRANRHIRRQKNDGDRK